MLMSSSIVLKRNNAIILEQSCCSCLHSLSATTATTNVRRVNELKTTVSNSYYNNSVLCDNFNTTVILFVLLQLFQFKTKLKWSFKVNKY